ncbi:MAG TPA: nitroreductase [Hyphomicrobiaceae bacterium]|nr:nitroreductase [Hyphomicrobiaceae bacterium]
MSNATIDLLLQRRSVKAAMMTSPGPSAAELETILRAASRVPDHKKVEPWRFIVFEGEARARFGDLLATACAAEEKEPPSPARLDMERQRFLRAPLVIGVVSQVRQVAGAPEWEQVLSCGAAIMNLVIATNALGFGSCWITEWYAYSPAVRSGLGLAEHERIAGFVYIGTAKERQGDRDRPDLARIVSRFPG